MIHRSRLLGAILAAAVATCAFTAMQARADDNADEADLHFQIGAERYQASDYRVALEHFLASNRLVPNRNVVFNIARTYEQLKQYPDAFRYYSQALDGETNPEARERIDTALARIAPNVAVLQVVTDPPGATVYLDRRDLGSRGSTPRKLGLPPGKYKVIVELPGHEPAEAGPVEIRAGSVESVTVPLKRILGTVRVDGEPAGAEVHVDEEKSPAVCTIPCTTTLPPGKHTLYFVHERYQPYLQQIDVVAKSTVTVRPSLNALRGSLVVNTDERDALVEVDGKPLGFTPSVLSVQSGQRKVRISLSGFRPIERVVNVPPNRETRIEVELRQLEEVSAASRTTESVEDAPSSVSIVPSAELRAMKYPTIAEALRGVRGVHVSDDLTYQSVGFRGFARLGDYGNRVLMLLDGHPLNDNWMGSSYVGYDGRTDLEDIERIEVVRGPGSVLYGTGAFSGVINLVTRKAQRTGGEVGLTASGKGVARSRGRVDLSLGKDAGLWMSVSGAKASGGDYYFKEFADEGGWARGVDGFRAGTVQGRVWWKSLTAQWMLHSREKAVPTGAYETLFADPRMRLFDTRGFFEVRFEPHLSSAVQLMTRAHVNYYGFSGEYPYDVGDAGVSHDRYRGGWAGGEARIIATPTSALRITAGGEGQHHFLVNQRYNDTETSIDRNDKYQIAAGYLLADLAPSKELRISGGTRLDWYSTFGSSVNPRAAVILHPYDRGTIKLMGGKAFRAPTVYEMYYWDQGKTQVQSPNLKPETIYSPEVEFSHRFTTTWTGVVAGYTNYIKDLIVARGDSTEESPLYYENSSSSVFTTGAEVELRREWRQGWSFSASYSYQHSRYWQAEGLRHVPNSPDHLAALRGAIPLIPRVLAGSMRLSIDGGRWDRNDHAEDPEQKKTDPAVIWDVVLTGEAARGTIRYALGVYNAFDWRWSVPVANDYRHMTMTQSGRTFLLSTSAHF